MVVDDQQPIRVSLELVLARSGYRVLSAASGLAAIQLAENNVVEGVIIDINMPVMDGFETCRQLQAQANGLGRSLRVWFMTGMSSMAMERRATEFGSLGVLRKPFDYLAIGPLIEQGFISFLLPRNSSNSEPSSSRSDQ